MYGAAGADLAIAVTKAGGFGQIAGSTNIEKLEKDLTKVHSTLGSRDGRLPIGVGLRMFMDEGNACMPILKKHRPAVVWLFAAKKTSDYAYLAERLRKELDRPQIWIQVGSVKDAVEIAQHARPDVMCVQGIDAGS